MRQRRDDDVAVLLLSAGASVHVFLYLTTEHLHNLVESDVALSNRRLDGASAKLLILFTIIVEEITYEVGDCIDDYLAHAHRRLQSTSPRRRQRSTSLALLKGRLPFSGFGVALRAAGWALCVKVGQGELGLRALVRSCIR